jgi:hypothetical protein
MYRKAMKDTETQVTGLVCDALKDLIPQLLVLETLELKNTSIRTYHTVCGHMRHGQARSFYSSIFASLHLHNEGSRLQIPQHNQ